MIWVISFEPYTFYDITSFFVGINTVVWMDNCKTSTKKERELEKNTYKKFFVSV